MGVSIQVAEYLSQGRRHPLRVRVVGEIHRDKDKVRHVDELHLDCGPEDNKGCSSKDVLAIMIADGPYQNTLPGQYNRLLACTSDFPGERALTVFPRKTRLEDLSGLYAIDARNGSIVVHSNINMSETGIKRWGHIVMPEKFVQPITTHNKRTGLYEINEPVKDYLRQQGASKSQVEELIRKLTVATTDTIASIQKRLPKVRDEIRAFKRERREALLERTRQLKQVVRQTRSALSAKEITHIEKIIADIKRFSCPGREERKLISDSNEYYPREIGPAQMHVLKRLLRHGLGIDVWRDKPVLPFALFQITTQRSSTQATIKRYIRTCVSADPDS